MQFITKHYKKLLALLGVAGVASLAVGTQTVCHKKKLEPASTPLDFKLATWKRILQETGKAFGTKNLSLVAAGVAFYATLAFFPLMAAAVAIAALTIHPSELTHVADAVTQYLPHDLASLITTQLANASGKHTSNILVAVFGIALSIFSVAGAMQNLMNAGNIAYEVEENRGFVKGKLVALSLTLGMIVMAALVGPLIFLGGSFLHGIGVPHVVTTIFSIVRWPLLMVFVMLALALFYRYGPNRPWPPKIQWVSWGAIIATILWTLMTILFFIYVQYFSNFTKSYSLFAGIIVLMMWLNYSTLVCLVGAELNHRLERHTLHSTTKHRRDSTLSKKRTRLRK